MPIKHEHELRDFAQRAVNLAEQIHQDWGSGAPSGGFQELVNVDMPKRGPDQALLNVERKLRNLFDAIETYLRRPRWGSRG